MSKVTITINTENDAFGQNEWQEAGEVSRILRQLSTDIQFDDIVDQKILKDLNGNTVGEVVVLE